VGRLTQLSSLELLATDNMVSPPFATPELLGGLARITNLRKLWLPLDFHPVIGCPAAQLIRGLHALAHVEYLHLRCAHWHTPVRYAGAAGAGACCHQGRIPSCAWRPSPCPAAAARRCYTVARLLPQLLSEPPANLRGLALSGVGWQGLGEEVPQLAQLTALTSLELVSGTRSHCTATECGLHALLLPGHGASRASPSLLFLAVLLAALAGGHAR
jgi:hypothetical protein